MRKLTFRICENKDADKLRSDKRINFDIATTIEQSFNFSNPIFQAPYNLPWLHANLCRTWSETLIVCFLMTRVISYLIRITHCMLFVHVI